MECYKVLSTPSSRLAPKYKGLHRSEPPYPKSDNDKQFISLWEKSIQHLEPLTNMGITTELTLDELKHLASLATQDAGERFEVIFFSENKECPHNAEYYGIDVTGVGGYSLLGENCFPDGRYPLLDVLNHFFRARLNSYGLFDNMDDAICFRAVLNDLNTLSPGCIEGEEWRELHIFKVI